MIQIPRVLSLVALALAASPGLAQLTVVSTTPAGSAASVDRASNVTISFDRTLDPATVTNGAIKVFGKVRGPYTVALSITPDGQGVTIDPATNFAAGEEIMVIVANTLRGSDGSALRSAGYSIGFHARADGNAEGFHHLGNVSNRDTSGNQTRIYGGAACDINRDGFVDIVTINEVSADLRVMVNTGNPLLPYGPIVTPYTPLPYESSPNAIADFDADGFIDMVVASYDDRVAIAFGNGDGTFDEPQIVTVPTTPRDIAILDGDGDGDQDIAIACVWSGQIAYLRNNGSRNFAAPTLTSAPGGPYGMTTGDLNNDGIMDLVAGCRISEQVRAYLGTGNGTFTPSFTGPIGGATWVVVAGDLNGDGHLDITAANSFSSNGSVLLGNGAGGFSTPVVHATGGHTVSSDLADLDGDGDLDWVLSSFGAGTWYTYRNNGAGVMTPFAEFDAPANPSCAIPADFDNDGDIDLVLTDEIADVLVVLRNGPACGTIDYNLDGLFPDDADLIDFLNVFGGGPCSTPQCGFIDFNGDGLFPDDADIACFLSVLAGGGCEEC